ncbi:pyrroline-5-carboxylate reductase [Sphingosinicella soli]|uniref:Pyrroline-5-carboxylate reductase n=1 Tax=Sphingosinicella soli TaxID=333708 RepID=A0A7W7B3M5_9SPHN|nr:pyrroline-5-carboxylate reductase [Sphingosinicella soli]MBB4632523.1 pyrroline-5-carboxylate reductase [Sphingosinicella soli]
MQNENKIRTLWLIGCGNMGSALLASWADAAEAVVVVDPGSPVVPAEVELFQALPEGAPPPDVVVLAVKPQVAPAALAGLPALVGPETIVISIMAGTMLAELAAFSGDAITVRAMPNTPAAVGKGVTALFANGLSDDARVSIEQLFARTGSVVWLEAENQFDAVTAVSGSGPAYVFRFIEALAAAGEAAGLPPELSEKLARATVVGAAALAEADPRSPRDLRAAVTSPGGTTQAGLEALDADPGLPALVRAAVRAAAGRSKELAEGR